MELHKSNENIRRTITERKCSKGSNNSVESVVDINNTAYDIELHGIPCPSYHDVKSPSGNNLQNIQPQEKSPNVDTDEESNAFTRHVEKVQRNVYGFLHAHAKLIKKVFLALLLLAYLVYFFYAVIRSPSAAIVVIALTGLVLCSVLYGFTQRRYGPVLYAGICVPVKNLTETRAWVYIKR